MKRVVEKMVREARKNVNEEWTLRIAETFKENNKKPWKGVNEVKMESLRLSSVRNLMSEKLTRENDSEVRRGEYFVQPLNDDMVSEVKGGELKKLRG